MHDKAVELHLELIFFINSFLRISLLIQSDSLKVEGEIVNEYLDTYSEYLFAIRKRYFRSHGLIGIKEISEHQCQNFGTIPLGLKSLNTLSDLRLCYDTLRGNNHDVRTIKEIMQDALHHLNIEATV